MTNSGGLPPSPWASQSTSAEAMRQAEAITASAPRTLDTDSARVVFDGQSGPFASIVLKGFFLQLLTLGIYRFWYVTRMRRAYWSHTSLNGDPLDYTGRAVELFKGFLIALVIFTPIALVSQFATLWGPVVGGIVSLLVLCAYVFLGHVAAFAARRYRLTRTAFRGLRFRLAGSALGYGVRAFGWTLLLIPTFGLVYPWMAASLTRRITNNTHFGDLAASFLGTGGQLFRRIAVPLLVVVSPIILGILAAIYGIATDNEMLIGFAAFGVALAIGLAFVLWPVFWSRVLVWLVENTQFGSLNFHSDFNASRAYRLYFGFLLFLGVGMSAVSVVIGTVVGVLAASGIDFNTASLDWRLALGMGLAWIGSLAVFSLLKAIFLDFRRWKYISTSITVHNLTALDAVHAVNEDASAYGEGLGDMSIGL